MTTIIDNAIDSQLCWGAFANFPALTWDGWHHYSDQNAEKYGQKADVQIPDIYSACLLQMVERANQVVGPNCFPDLSLYGAGLHRIEFLGDRTDDNRTPRPGLRQFRDLRLQI